MVRKDRKTNTKKKRTCWENVRVRKKKKTEGKKRKIQSGGERIDETFSCVFPMDCKESKPLGEH